MRDGTRFALPFLEIRLILEITQPISQSTILIKGFFQPFSPVACEKTISTTAVTSIRF